jgi:hypothetical protein
MAEPDLIGDYRSALRRRLTGRSNVDDIVDEVEDHLRSAVEKLVRLGNDPDTAQRLTLERFGDPVLVAHAFATTASGGLSMPTRFTRTAGYVAIVAAVAWIAAGAFTVIGQTSLVTEFSELKYFAWASLILVAAIATLVAFLGLLRRAGTAGDWPARFATLILAAGVFTIVAFAWFWPAGAALLTLGSLLVVRRARAAALPLDAWSWLLVLAFPVGIGLFLGLWLLRTGPVDEYGNYPLAFVSGTIVGAVLFAVALARVGRWLAREVPLDGVDGMVGA